MKPAGPESALLRDVSRSFYLSLRVLPGRMRPAVSLAYLLARASDTLADTAAVPATERLTLLDGFIAEMEGGGAHWRKDLTRFSQNQHHQGEQRLLERLNEAFTLLESLPAAEQHLIREVIATITSGQRLDVERFAQGGGGLPDAAALLDYCHRVAGCVGIFWTRIGFETMGKAFSRSPATELEKMGEHFGKGLQLVNILRDLPEDLSNGRCYLPLANPTDRNLILEAAAQWRKTAHDYLGEGLDYARCMRGKRLKVAAALPALLGKETLTRLDAADWSALEQRIKVPRSVVRRCLWRALWV